MPTIPTALDVSRRQRSHVLLAWSEARAGCEVDFLGWYQSVYRHAVAQLPGILRSQHYERHEVDITSGLYEPVPFRYLGIHDLAVDGARSASRVIDSIDALHRAQGAAQPSATWLYYPASEKVGLGSQSAGSLRTLAFANALPGREAEFREWYATQHLRHALNIPVLVSGQCLERCTYQKPGALEPSFSLIAIYEQDGTPEEFLAAAAAFPEETFEFPSMDWTRFAEAVYRPLPQPVRQHES